MVKPLLYSNYKLDDNKNIINRIDHQEAYEVYSLTSDDFLIVFFDVEESLINSFGKDIVEINIGEKIFKSIIVEKYSRIRFLKKIDKILNPTGFSAVAGMKELKEKLIKDVIEPLKNPTKYEKFRLNIPNGILLFGPPGCGKTFIIRKLAEEIGYSFFEIKHSDLASTYIHGMVEKIKEVFKSAEEAKPSIIFFDEIDGLVPIKDTLGGNQTYKQEEINEFLMQFNDAGKKNILIIGATNRPHMIDKALLRPGRMDKIIFVSPPDQEARKELFKIYMTGVPSKDIDYDRLAFLTDLYASVDIEYIVKEAARKAINENKEFITQKDFEVIIYSFRSSITKADINKYNNFLHMERK